jgi:polysaccharide export outer membrane protein
MNDNRICPGWQGRIGGAMLALMILAACAPRAVVPPPPPAEPVLYRIGAGDVLDLIVWREENLSGSLNVRPDGMISVPLVGDLAAAGKTPEELSNDIKTGLQRFVENPNVVVRVSATARRFYIVGNVRAPGMYEMRADQTLLQALAVAGGFTEFANRGRVRIVRQGGAEQAFERDYDDIVSGEIPDVRLEPNDTIIVP